MFTLINADEDDPRLLAETFAAVAALTIDVLGKEQSRVLFEAVIEQEGKALS
ncbi:MAG: hypothetical protein RLW68_00865 [Devosia marina]|uniref:hypothetical protein n=1 Tax=Devosia marina TaxID=2683198 RepID=UPI0032ED0AAF